MDSRSPAGQPTNDDDPVLLRGTHNPPGAGSWIVLLMGLLCAAAALKFWLLDDAADVAPYPASVAVSAFGWFALAWLRKGTFELTASWITGRKRVGGRFQVALDKVGQVQLKETQIRLLAPDGRDLIRLVTARPTEVGGLLWFLVRYRERLPAEVLRGLAGPANPARHREVHPGVARTFWEAEGEASRKAFGDRGLLISLGQRHLYIPCTETVGEPGLKDLLGLVLPVTWHRQLKLNDAPGLEALPLEAFADHTLAADLDAARQAELLGMVAVELGGIDLEQPVGKDGSLWGELAGRTVSIQARTPDGLLTARGDAPAETLIRKLNPRRLLIQLAIATAMLGPGIGLVVAGVCLDDPGRGTPGWVLELCGIAGTILILIGGIWLFIGPFTMSKATYCRTCQVPVRSGRAGFPVDREEEIVNALTLDDPAALSQMAAREVGQGRIELSLDYCPKCRAMGQLGLDRVVQFREPLMKANTPLSGEAVAILASVTEEQARARQSGAEGA